MLKITIRQLECLIAAAEEGSVSLAAEKLYLTQSTVSGHLALLEKTLGKKLLVRGARQKTKLTAAGEEALAAARQLVALAASIENADGEDGAAELSIASSTVPSGYLLPGLMAEYAALRPEVSFRLYEGDSGDVAEKILAGTVRLGFLGSKRAGGGLRYKKISSDELVLITPATEEFARFKEEQDAFFEIVTAYPLVRREEGSGTRRSVDALLKRVLPEGASVRVVAIMNSPERVITAVENGMGVAVVSRLFCAAEEKAGRLFVFTPGNADASRAIYLAEKTGAALTREERRFSDFVLKHCRNK